MIKLSIITINYNNVSGLKKTMESVFAQTSIYFIHVLMGIVYFVRLFVVDNYL